jgi:aminoglycoside phosphotransferase (APT) family kinase protein
LGRRFGITGALVRAELLSGGHIHDTFLATYDSGDGVRRHVHQRVNAHVFPDPTAVTENVARVAAHLRGAGVPAPALAVAEDGRPYVVAADSSVWRSYPYLEAARCYRRFPSPAIAETAAVALGRLVGVLTTLPGPPPSEAIPGFHDFDRRLAAFDAVLVADRCSRASGCRPEIEAVRAASHHLPPERMVHNDAKAANVLIDDATGAVAAILDLDTVAPGTVLFDFGDLVRSGAPAEEVDGDTPDLRLPVLEALVAGYLVGARGLLTEGEVALLGLAGPLMAYEAALRYLTDHLDGDRYFRTARPGHNLSRAGLQLSLLRDLLQARPAVEAAVGRLG